MCYLFGIKMHSSCTRYVVLFLLNLNWSSSLHESKCTGSAGCSHEFCTICALYLCATSNTVAPLRAPPGSIPCPLCRQAIVSFIKLPGASLMKAMVKASSSTSVDTVGSLMSSDPASLKALHIAESGFQHKKIKQHSLFRSLSFQKFL